MRVHLHQCYMTFEEADKVQYYLQSLPGVVRAKVSERTCDATIYYGGTAKQRAKLVRALSGFDYETTEVSVPDHTGRELNHKFEDRMFWHIAGRFVTRLFLPLSIRSIISFVKAVPFVIRGLNSLIHGRIDVHVLDAASVTFAIVRSDFDTAGSVMFLLGIGDIMEEWTHRKSVDDLANAMSLHVDKVWVKTKSGEEVLVGVGEVHRDSRIIVRTGNMIPLDGLVESGDAMVNQASITGEPLSVRKTEGGAVFAGTVVEEGELVVRVTKDAGTGQYDRIVSMIEESEKLRSDTEAKASDLADKLVPVTFGAAVLTYLLTRDINRAYSIMMVDFCCALKLAIPISVLSAMREAQEHQISVKGGKFMENFAKAETIVFDKTGTITRAVPKVRDVVAFNGQDPKEMLRLAACLEEHYPHSIANAVVRCAKEQGLFHEEKHSKVEYIVAHGIASTVDGVKVRIGSWHFIFEDEKAVLKEDEKEKFDSLPDQYSHLYLAIGGVLSAVILIEDPIKDEAKDAIRALHEAGFSRVVMLTGDSGRTAKAVAKLIGVDDFRAEVLPEDKAAFIKQEHEAGRKVVMVGDGVNDSPALSAADVGVAINSGAAIAREIADVTISEDDLKALVTLRRLCNGLNQRTTRNYRFILTFNSGLIVLGMLGLLQPTMTALLHNMSTILIALHSMTNVLPESKN
ncbi:MAG: heavy metal translocating P-type ATPase [Lachnospiraceae bacterium]|jgi:heavy metal translocating P-type ATPase